MTYVYDKAAYKDYWRGRVFEVRDINQKIWGHVCAAALIEFGAKLSNGGVGGGPNYKAFARTLGTDPSKYTDFTFAGGQQDLEIQMWHVLRCGLLHSFCLMADATGMGAGARHRPFMLASVNDGYTTANHVTNYTEHGRDACLLILEPFVEDIWIAMERIFDDTNKDASVRACAEQNPPFNAFASLT